MKCRGVEGRLVASSLRKASKQEWCRQLSSLQVEKSGREVVPGRFLGGASKGWKSSLSQDAERDFVGEYQRVHPGLSLDGFLTAADHHGVELRAQLQDFGRTARCERALQSWTGRKQSREGQLNAAVEVLNDLVREGFYAPALLWYHVLSMCVVEKDVHVAEHVHALILEGGQESNTFVANHVIRMYASHGRLQQALQVFSSLATPDSSMWASIILAHTGQGRPAEAIRMYQQMRQSVVKPNNYAFMAALKACSCALDFAAGKQVHADVLESIVEPNLFVGNCLVDMYAKCGGLEYARRVFDTLPIRNVVTWNAMIAGYVQQGFAQEALALYATMPKDGSISADRVTYVCLLKACASVRALSEGKTLHYQIQGTEWESDVVVGSSLVDMYAKCGTLEHARGVFDRMPARDVVTWTALIAGYSQQGRAQEALSLYSCMRNEGVSTANHITFACVLKACASLGALREGKELHIEIQDKGMEFDEVVSSSLVDMYTQCGSLQDARGLFDRLPVKGVVAWNALARGYAQQGLPQEALTLYARMRREDVLASHGTSVCLLKACASICALHEGRQLHLQLERRGLAADLVIGSSLIDMYAKCGSLEDARRVFDSLPVKNVVTWTAIISGYAQQGVAQEALALYTRMQQEGITSVDRVLFMCLLKACAGIGALQGGKELHTQIQEHGLETDLDVANSLIDMYAKCGSLEDACRVFEGLSTKDVVTWTALISGLSHHGLGEEALGVYASMRAEGMTPANNVTLVCLLKACGSVGALDQGKWIHSLIQDRGLDAEMVLGNCLVDMYAKCESLEDARGVFDRLPVRDVTIWTAMIAGYARHGPAEEALVLYASMQEEGLVPADHVTFVCLLKACAAVGALHQGKQLHIQIQERGFESEVVVGNSLVDMYAKCGSLEDAFITFDRLPTRNVVTWNTLLAGYSQHNDGRKAIQCFQEMLQHGVVPDGSTFLCLFVACSRTGLVDEGLQFFNKMVHEYGINPTVSHHNALVDLLGRSGRLHDAESILQTMPSTNNIVGWVSLLSSCKVHSDLDRGARCFDHIVGVEPQHSAAYVLLGNIYANAGRWRDVERIEALRKAAGACKKPARAWIEVNNKVQAFTVGQDSDDVLSKLRSVNHHLNGGGPKLVSEADREDALCGHAEKLALAYGLLNTADGTTLLVTKNLRMCNDCHIGTKVMSRVEKREIVVRDAHCVHRFVNGFCSCGDGQSSVC